MIVTIVAISLPWLNEAGWTLGAALTASGLTRLGRVGGQNGKATREIEIDLRPQADGEAKVGTG
jgi:hypothetical protein